MATNFFFNNFKSSQEQLLLEDLIIESIRIYGEDMLYVPRNINAYDQLYAEDDQSSYTKTFPIEMYIKSVDGFSGDGNFMSKFGLEIRDQVIFSMAQRVFTDEIGTRSTITRPREGDLVYFPLNNKCFQIKFVNKFEMFYQLGALQTWEITCELFEYSNEIFKTGIPEIDRLQLTMSTNVLDFAIVDEDGTTLILDEENNYLVNESYSIDTTLPGSADNEYIQTESDRFVDWSTKDPFSEGHI